MPFPVNIICGMLFRSRTASALCCTGPGPGPALWNPVPENPIGGMPTVYGRSLDLISSSKSLTGKARLPCISDHCCVIWGYVWNVFTSRCKLFKLCSEIEPLRAQSRVVDLVLHHATGSGFIPLPLGAFIRYSGTSFHHLTTSIYCRKICTWGLFPDMLTLASHCTP